MVQLELASIKDAEQIKSISVKSFTPDFELYGSYPPGIESLNWYETEIEKGNYYKIICDGDVAGGIYLIPISADEMEIKFLFISDAFQNMRLGSTTMELIESTNTLFGGKRYRILNIMDEFNREFIEFEVGVSLPASKVIQTLQRAVEFRGKPQSIRVDNGPEFISHKLEQWCYIHSIELKFIQPGSPTQNSRMERLNGSMRREFFDAYPFDTLTEVKIMAEEWVYDYNNYRPHSTLGKLSPIEYLDKYNLEMNCSV